MKVLYIDALTEKTAIQNTSEIFNTYSKYVTTLTFDYRGVYLLEYKKLTKSNKNLSVIEMAKNKSKRFMNDQLYHYVIQHKPDFIHIGKGELIEGNTLKNIRSKYNPFIVHYYGDFQQKFPNWVIDIDQYCNYALFCTMYIPHLNIYQKRKIKTMYWQPGINTQYFENISDIKPIYDIVFIGNNSATFGNIRRELFSLLSNTQYKVGIFGKNWNIKSNNISILDPATKENFAECCRLGKITLGENNDRNNIPLYSSWRRTFNCMASERMHLTYYIPGIETIFENRKELVWFKDLKEFMKELEFYINADQERSDIAKEGKKRIFNDFTWDNKILQLLKLYKGK